MFNPRTVFIIGAGASCELGLPSGDGLMAEILRALDTSNERHGFKNNRIQRALMSRVERDHGWNWTGPMQKYQALAHKITQALPHARSIDTYLDSQKEDGDTVLLGKLAIAECILRAEKGSYLATGTDPSGKKLGDSWYRPLGRILTAGHQASDLSQLFANVSFVVFNYDRCLELYLLKMVMEYFNVDEASALGALSTATVIHVYGQVGTIWRGRGAQNFVPFGGGRDDDIDLAEVASGIRTYTESIDSVSIERIRLLVKEAQTLVFMGFGFIAQNMTLLGPPVGSNATRIMATAYQTSNQDCAAIEERLIDSFGRHQIAMQLKGLDKKIANFSVHFERGTCRTLMDNNVFTLADQ